MRYTVPLLLCLTALPMFAGGGLLGLDQRGEGGAHGIWSRGNQKDLAEVAIVVIVTGALWHGSETRLGRTFWQAVDASALSYATVGVTKRAFSRSRPRETGDPDAWFQGRGHASFPSGEVALQASVVTPFIAEYHEDHPWVWALAALPAYDAIARVKARAHWQTDVLAGLAIGSAWGLYAHHRKTPLLVGYLSDGITVGFKTRF